MSVEANLQGEKSAKSTRLYFLLGRRARFIATPVVINELKP